MTNELYEVNDLALATTISIFFPIDCIQKKKDKRVIFFFKRTPELEKLVEGYWRRELKIEPQMFFYQLKLIKSRIYSND